MKNVLVVEDDNIMLKAIGNILGRGGYGVLSATNGKEAFDLVDTGDYDVIITDLMLPYANGLEIVSRVRNDPSKKHVGIIVVSSMGHEDMVTEAFALGADDYLKKPIMAGELASRIKKLLAGKNLLKNSLNNGNNNSGNTHHIADKPHDTVHRQILQPADGTAVHAYTTLAGEENEVATLEKAGIAATAANIINKTQEPALKQTNYDPAKEIIVAPEENEPVIDEDVVMERAPRKLSAPPKSVEMPVASAMRAAGKYEKYYFNIVIILIFVAVVVLGILMRNIDPDAF